MPSSGMFSLAEGLLLSAGGELLPVELPDPAPDGLTYVTTTTAARLLGVAKCTITLWKTKEYLRPVPGSPPRRPVYLWDDVLDAELTARRNALRTSGTDIQVQRNRGEW